MIVRTCSLRFGSAGELGYCGHGSDSLLLIGVHGLLEGNAELLADRLELLEVLLVLVLVLNLELDTY